MANCCCTLLTQTSERNAKDLLDRLGPDKQRLAAGQQGEKKWFPLHLSLDTEVKVLIPPLSQETRGQYVSTLLCMTGWLLKASKCRTCRSISRCVFARCTLIRVDKHFCSDVVDLTPTPLLQQSANSVAQDFCPVSLSVFLSGLKRLVGGSRTE